uniref:Uncharacterized protein n=1 Tax=Oryza barthii TaxID=65489 RepID=A0A0D3GFI2_9ORYZ
MAARDGKVIRGFPLVFIVGPYSSLASETKAADADQSSALAWLNQQPMRSVVYIAFGNRYHVSDDQLREIAAGLEASGC